EMQARRDGEFGVARGARARRAALDAGVRRCLVDADRRPCHAPIAAEADLADHVGDVIGRGGRRPARIVLERQRAEEAALGTPEIILHELALDAAVFEAVPGMRAEAGIAAVDRFLPGRIGIARAEAAER